MPVLSDLESAIRRVLTHSEQWRNTSAWIVDASFLRNLQTEYNIHFREPDEEDQLSVIPDK
jgi:hypothetical protein